MALAVLIMSTIWSKQRPAKARSAADLFLSPYRGASALPLRGIRCHRNFLLQHFKRATHSFVRKVFRRNSALAAESLSIVAGTMSRIYSRNNIMGACARLSGSVAKSRGKLSSASMSARVPSSNSMPGKSPDTSMSAKSLASNAHHQFAEVY